MTMIHENDVVGLTRSLNYDLAEGLVGLVMRCQEDFLEIKFPIQGRETLYAQVAPEDVKFLIGNPRKQ